MPEFRSGTVVKFRYSGVDVYGVITRFKRKYYGVIVYINGGSWNGRGEWSVQPHELSRVAGKKRIEVLQAQAELALTGKVHVDGNAQ